jgi:hypothetical protein
VRADVRGVALELAPRVCAALALDWDGSWRGAPAGDALPVQSATSTTPLSVRSW